MGVQTAFGAMARRLPASWAGWFLAPPGVAWVACSTLAVVLAAVGEDAAAGVCLLAAAAFLGLERGLAARVAAARRQARMFTIRAGEILFAAAAAFAVAGSAGPGEAGTREVWLCFVCAFSTVAQEYSAVVFEQVVRASGLGEPTTLGIRRPDGSVVGLREPLPWALDVARWHGSILGPLLAAHLLLGRPSVLLAAFALLFLVGSLWTTVLRAVVIRRCEARRGAGSPAPPRLSGPERWERLRAGLSAARDDAFWGLVVARPLVMVCLYPIADVRWLTPNLVTLVSSVVCIAAGVLGALGVPELTWVAVGLVFVRSLLDSMDGQLARYRGLSSHFGSFVDKAADSWCWAALYVAPAVVGHAATGARWALLVPLAGVTVLFFQGVTGWLGRALRPRAAAGSAETPFTLASWARSLWRVVLFEEPDYYLWISLGLLTGRWEALASIIAVPAAVRFAWYNWRRFADVLKVWNASRSVGGEGA